MCEKFTKYAKASILDCAFCVDWLGRQRPITWNVPKRLCSPVITSSYIFQGHLNTYCTPCIQSPPRSLRQTSYTRFFGYLIRPSQNCNLDFSLPLDFCSTTTSHRSPTLPSTTLQRWKYCMYTLSFHIIVEFSLVLPLDFCYTGVVLITHC